MMDEDEQHLQVSKMMNSDSDSDDDRETLITQNDVRNHHFSTSSPSPRRSSSTTATTFHILDHHNNSTSATARRHFRRFFDFSNVNSTNTKRFLKFAIFVPIVLLLIFFFFTTDNIRNIFSSANLNLSRFSNNNVNTRMRESELQALYLLRQQQLSLFTLWNRTTGFPIVNSPDNINNNTNSSMVFTPTLFEDIKSSILHQISVNKEIQQVLLSAHKTGNSSSSSLDDSNVVGNEPTFDYERCRRKPDPTMSQRRTIEWNPKPNKFLFAICLSGQMSNHLICLEKHMFFAALLNRVLVIPSSKVDYQYSRVLDMDHINNCVGRKVAITFEEFAALNKNHVHIDRFMCYFALPQPCYMDEEHVKKLKHELGVSIGRKLEPVWKTEDVKKPSKMTVQDVQAKFGSANDDVIAIGDVFYADVDKDWVMQPHGPIAHKCSTLIEPSRLIMLTAQRFIQTFLGRKFIALHFRRHGFLKFCNGKKPSCFYPIPQAADCIARVVERSNAPVIYLSTDAAESETGLLQSLIVINGKTIPLVKRPPRNGAEKWDALLYRHSLDGDNQVEAMLDKTICAMSGVFIGSSGSTFTEDILRLRKDWGAASLCDEYMCQGKDPDFIAGDE